jgi:hypothetical protein
MKKTLGSLIAIFALIFGAIAVSQAAGQVSKVYACVAKSNGDVRIVAASKKCTKKETKINWGTGASVTSATAVTGIYLQPSDFDDPYGAPAVYESKYFNGYGKKVWNLQDATNEYATITTTFVIPNEWSSAKDLLITVYWSAESTQGDVILYFGSQQYAENDDLSTYGTTSPDFADEPAGQDTVLKTTTTVAYEVGTEFMELGIERYMYNEGNWIDTNEGDISILGVKVEPLL